MKKFILPLLASISLFGSFANAAITEPNASELAKAVITEPNASELAKAVSMYSYDEHAMPLEAGKTFDAADQKWVSNKFTVITSDNQVYHLTIPTPYNMDDSFRLYIHHEVKISDFKDTLIPIDISGKKSTVRVSVVDGYRLDEDEATRYSSYDFNVSIQLEPYTYVQFGYEMPQSKWSVTKIADVPSNDFTNIAGTTPPSMKSVYDSAEKYLDVVSRIKVEKIK